MSESKFFYNGYELIITVDESSYNGECEKLEYYARDEEIGSLITNFKSYIDHKKKKELPDKTLRDIKANLDLFEKETKEIFSRFHRYLISQGFVFRIKGKYETTSYCAIHGNFLKEWEADNWDDSIPDWAEIAVTYEVYKAK